MSTARDAAALWGTYSASPLDSEAEVTLGKLLTLVAGLAYTPALPNEVILRAGGRSGSLRRLKCGSS